MTEDRMRLVQLIDGILQEGRNLQGNLKSNFMDAAQAETKEHVQQIAEETAEETLQSIERLLQAVKELRTIA